MPSPMKSQAPSKAKPALGIDIGGRLRGLAVEWIQDVIGPGLWRLLRPIIDASSPRAQAEARRRLFGIDTGDLDDALTLLITGPDPKLQRGALRHLPPGGMGGLSPRLQEAVREAARDPDRRVRAAAEEALQRFESGAVA